MHLGFAWYTVLLHNSFSNLHNKDDCYTFLHPFFGPFDTICKLYTPLLSPWPAVGWLMINQQFLFISCCSPLLHKHAAASSWLRGPWTCAVSSEFLEFTFFYLLPSIRSWKKEWGPVFPKREHLPPGGQHVQFATNSVFVYHQPVLNTSSLPITFPSCFLYFSLQLCISS